MAKKRKTRQQKLVADLRHNFNHPLVNQVTNQAPFEAKTKLQPNIVNQSAQKTQRTIAINSYPYLAKDLTKTGLLTLAILAFQIVLFFLLKNHTLIIPGLNY